MTRGTQFRGVNGCMEVAAAALRHLADNERPIGGEDRYNAIHLLQLADELAATQKTLHRVAANHVQIARQRAFETHPTRYGLPEYAYLPTTEEEKAAWQPHEWVLLAMLQAAIDAEQPPRAQAAEATLQGQGYTYHGGEYWKPPIGEAPPDKLPIFGEKANGERVLLGTAPPPPGMMAKDYLRDCGLIDYDEEGSESASALYAMGRLISYCRAYFAAPFTITPVVQRLPAADSEGGLA